MNTALPNRSVLLPYHFPFKTNYYYQTKPIMQINSKGWLLYFVKITLKFSRGGICVANFISNPPPPPSQRAFSFQNVHQLRANNCENCGLSVGKNTLQSFQKNKNICLIIYPDHLCSAELYISGQI